MSPPKKSRLIRRLRGGFRWARITVWFLIFLAVVAVAYLHLLGLPDFLKRPLLARMRERGFEAQFTSAKLGWGPAVIIENASFRRPDQPLSPRLSAAQTHVLLNWTELLHRRLKVDGFRVQQGKLQVPASGVIGDFLSLDHVSLNLALLTNDTIQLTGGSATFHGMQISVEGTVTHFSEMRDWSFRAMTGTNQNQAPAMAAAGTNQNPASPDQTEEALSHFGQILDQVRFVSPPKLEALLSADGRNPDSLRGELLLRAAGARSPWGEFRGLNLAAACNRPVSSGPAAFMKLRVSAEEVVTARASGRNLYLTADVAHVAGTNLEASVNFAVDRFLGRLPAPAQTNSVTAVRLRGNGSLTVGADLTNVVSAGGTLLGNQLTTPWGSAESANVICRGAAVAGSPGTNSGWGPWAVLAGRELAWAADLVNVSSPQLQFGRLQCAGSWRAPEIVLTNLQVSLYGGSAGGRARLDAASRELETAVEFDFDTHRIAPLLTPSARDWMAQFGWEKPPKVAAAARLLLPPWTNAPADWWDAVLPTLQIAGDFSAGPASYRGVTLSSAQSRFTYTNEVWNLPRLRAARPEGNLDLDITSSDATEDFVFMVDSTVSPGIARPFLPESQKPLLDEAVFPIPPQIHGVVSGNWGQGSRTAFSAQIMATNFVADHETVDGLVATVAYTNLQMRVTEAHLWKDGREAKTPLVEVDFRADKIATSNLISTVDPRVVTRVLGALAPDWLKAIGFDTPPAVELSGSFVPEDELATDLHFTVTGQNFRYANALAEQLSGQVNWTGRSVALTNVQGGLYGGTLRGWGVFDYTAAGDTDFRGQFALTNIELSRVVPGLLKETNKIEGILDGRLAITDGNSRDVKSWVARGDVSINKALLWDIKIFGVFSGLLDAVVPGSGDSRAYQAKADFLVTNALLATDNLEIRSTHLRLLYRGTMNLKTELDARAEARVLRDAPILGPLFFGWALAPLDKLFEYKIGGTFNAPTYKTVYLPEFLMMLARPFHTLRSLLPPAEPTPPADAPKSGK